MIARIKIQVPYVTLHRNIAKQLFPANFHFNSAFVGLVLSYYLSKQHNNSYNYKEHANKERQKESNCTNFISYPSVLIAYVAFGEARFDIRSGRAPKMLWQQGTIHFPTSIPLPSLA